MGLRVLACVPESVFLKGLEAVFPDGEIVFCGGAVDEATLFDMLPQAGADVLLYELTGESDLPYLSILRRNFPKLRVIVLLEPESEHLAFSAMEKGAAECLPKTLTRETLFAFLGRFAGRECSPADRRDGVWPQVVGLRASGTFSRGGVERVDLASLFRHLAAGRRPS